MDKKLIDELICKLEKLATNIYEGKENEGVAKIGKLIPEIAVASTWIVNSNIKDQLMNNALTPLLSAMEENDSIYMADIIHYELIGILRNIE